MNDQSIEQEIQAKGLTAFRVTLADVEANIVTEHYFTAAQGVSAIGSVYVCSQALTEDQWEARLAKSKQALGLLTFCVLVLQNGFTVTGESFDVELGKKIARQNAINKIWPLMGYELRSQLARGAA